MSENDLLHLNANYDLWKQRRGAIPGKVDPFVYYCVENVMRPYDLAQDEIAYGITDGTGDGGVDAIFFLINRELVRDDSDTPKHVLGVDLAIFQVKNADEGFKPTEMLKLIIFTQDLLALGGPPVKTLQHKYHPHLLEIMATFREKYSAVSGQLPPVSIRYHYMTKGDETTANLEAKDVAEKVKAAAKQGLSKADVQYMFMNAQAILEEAAKRPLDARKLVWAEQPLMAHEGYIGLVRLSDYNNLLRDESGALDRRVFESNVRGFQQASGVNEQIMASLRERGPNFWLLNNGITILAEKFGGAGREVVLHGPQIVNGLQTSRCIAHYFDEGADAADTRSIMVRVISLEKNPDPAVSDAIIKATNSQNKMGAASLRATDRIQRRIEEVFAQHQLYYDRRKGVHRDEGRPLAKIVSVLELVQAVVAILLQRPNDARARPGNYISDDTKYLEIFTEDKYPLSAYLQAIKLMRRVDEFLGALPLEKGQPRNVGFYVATHLVCHLTGKATPGPADVVAINLDHVNESQLDKSYKAVWKRYSQLGGDDAAAKGTGLAAWLRRTTRGSVTKRSASARASA